MVARWLKTTSPPAENDEDGRWLRELLAIESNKDKMILTLVEPLIVRMAENCFRMESSRQNTISAFQIAREFLSTVGGQPGAGMTRWLLTSADLYTLSPIVQPDPLGQRQ
jgi:hypothetical protein